jgi:hypothetical protein
MRERGSSPLRLTQEDSPADRERHEYVLSTRPPSAYHTPQAKLSICLPSWKSLRKPRRCVGEHLIKI